MLLLKKVKKDQNILYLFDKKKHIQKVETFFYSNLLVMKADFV